MSGEVIRFRMSVIDEIVDISETERVARRGENNQLSHCFYLVGMLLAKRSFNAVAFGRTMSSIWRPVKAVNINAIADKTSLGEWTFDV